MTHQDVVSDVVSRLEGARAELASELQRVDAALAALKGVPQRVASPPRSLPDGRVVVISPMGSIRSAVLAKMEETQGPWSAGDMTAALEQAPSIPKVSHLSNAVRTALVSLASEKAITRVERGRYVATKWYPAPYVDTPTPDYVTAPGYTPDPQTGVPMT